MHSRQGAPKPPGDSRSNDNTRATARNATPSGSQMPTRSNDVPITRNSPSSEASGVTHPVRVSKHASHRLPLPDPNANRGPTARKPATVQTPVKRPQSSFTLIAPLRTQPKVAKSQPLRPAFIVAHEDREKETKKEEGDYELGARSDARPRTVPRMSVQRRGGGTQRMNQRGLRAPPTLDRPTGLDAIPDARTYVGRGGKLRSGDDGDKGDESSSDLSSSDESDRERNRGAHQRGRKSIRQPAPGLKRPGMKAARKQPILTNIATKSARKRGVGEASRLSSFGRGARRLRAEPTSDDSVIEISDSDEDIDELLDAFSALTVGEARLRQRRKLPFDLRNLRVGFEHRCRQYGIRIAPAEVPRRTVKVVYRHYLDEGDSDAWEDFGRIYQQWVGFIPDWRCPLCDLHKPFRTREMLKFHLEQDHSNCNTSWKEGGSRNDRRWTLRVAIPDADVEDVPSSEGSDSNGESEDVNDEEETEPPSKPYRESSERPRNNAKDPLFLDDTDESSSPIIPSTVIPGVDIAPPSSATSAVAAVTPPSTAIYEVEDVRLSPLPTPVESRRSPVRRVGRPSLKAAPRSSYRGSLDRRYPSPPPPTDRLGPAAQYPFLPETDAAGQPIYSCRPGGPRLFDLLNTLPMDEFGLMSWYIIDREEVLFEATDMLDEDKVMLALWNRWIMINRTSFVFDGKYEVGVTRFIDEYWRMIHQAAGWRALRSFLIMLNKNAYITLTQVVKMLGHYEQKTGMKFWYQDDDAE